MPRRSNTPRARRLTTAEELRELRSYVIRSTTESVNTRAAVGRLEREIATLRVQLEFQQSITKADASGRVVDFTVAPIFQRYGSKHR